MKKLKSLFFAGLALSSVLYYSSCTTDEDILPGTGTAPSVNFVSNDPTGVNVGQYPTTDFEAAQSDQYVYVAIEATAGDSDLKTLTVQLDGANVPTSDFTLRDIISNEDIVSNNPALILGENVNNFTIEVGVLNDGSNVAKELVLIVEDADGLSTSASISFVTSTTPIEQTITGVLLNQSGPSGQGGLDLDTGEGTGTVDASGAAAEIKDEGIDLNLPNDENWKAQISGINGSEIRMLNAAAVDAFDFDAVTTKDEIATFFSEGEALPNTNSAGEPTSNSVQIGDVSSFHQGQRSIGGLI